MNAKITKILSGAACLLVGGWASGFPTAASAADTNIALENQTPGPAPSSGHVWLAGHWDSVDGQWKWVAGHWDLPPSRSAIWVPGHWIQGSSGWVWVNGAWNVGEAPQSYEAPPQPPGANGQPVPSPSTPAPNVSGQYYAPGNPPTTVYADPGDTYYSPEYAYPGYYWDGSAWAWGFWPGFALGLGWWGPGWGHGYYHGGWHGGGHGGWHGGDLEAGRRRRP